MRSSKLAVSPVEVFRVLQARRNCCFLDSSRVAPHALGRYSVLAADPVFVLEASGQNPFRQLREAMRDYRVSRRMGLPFMGGAVGYLAYDLGVQLQGKIRKVPKPHSRIPALYFAFYNTAVIIDHAKKLLHIVATGFPEKSDHLSRVLAAENLKKLCALLGRARPCRSPRKRRQLPLRPVEVRSNFTRAGYLAAIRKAKEYIRRGDIYQVNLSQTLSAKSPLAAPEIYERLRSVSPSDFGAYLDAGDFQVISSSPERFLKLDGKRAVTRPMKGTRPRGGTRLRDRLMKQALMKSEKDKAELVMIVDLERNDLGRVCDYHSVNVPRLRELESYRTVFQTTATVEGLLHPGKDRFDLLDACFPGGSVTGCPKIRAMEIIEELEPTRRSVYTGSLGYLSFSGEMEFNILIRTILKNRDEVSFGVGGGIVADSVPEEEYAETLVKARGMLQAIGALWRA